LAEGHNRSLWIDLYLSGDDLQAEFDQVARKGFINANDIGRSPFGFKTSSDLLPEI
jgi:hypothetical protein